MMKYRGVVSCPRQAGERSGVEKPAGEMNREFGVDKSNEDLLDARFLIPIKSIGIRNDNLL